MEGVAVLHSVGQDDLLNSPSIRYWLDSQVENLEPCLVVGLGSSEKASAALQRLHDDGHMEAVSGARQF